MKVSAIVWLFAVIGGLFFILTYAIPPLNEAIWHTEQHEIQQQQEYQEWWDSLTPEEQDEIMAEMEDPDNWPDSRWRYVP